MIITICNQQFNTNEIKDICIRENNVLIDTEDDYFNLRYTKEEEIKEAKAFLQFKEMTRKELLDAVNIIMITCDFFLNRKEQCAPCPLKKKEGCIFDYTPIDWRN